jgi:small-conductance mechanosensitive channel
VTPTPDPVTTSIVPTGLGPSAPSPGCLSDALCSYFAGRTGLGWLADTGYYLVLKPIRIVLIIAAAVALRAIAQRLIRRTINRAGSANARRLWRDAAVSQEAPRRVERRQQRAEALGSVLRSLASIAIFGIAAMMVLGELGVQLAPLLASAGIAGVALGFGAQNLVKDFLAGIFILLEDQYGVGDAVDVGDVSGTVEEVGLRITTIRDARGVLWYIRNGEIIRVGNRSQGWAVVIVDVPVGFRASMKRPRCCGRPRPHWPTIPTSWTTSSSRLRCWV